jgi:hypothetical protein
MTYISNLKKQTSDIFKLKTTMGRHIQCMDEIACRKGFPKATLLERGL